MLQTIESSEPRFDIWLGEFMNAKIEAEEWAYDAANDIIDGVLKHGDAALVEYTRKFDGFDLDIMDIAYTPEEIDEEIGKVPESEHQALQFALARVRDFHRNQLPEDADWTDASGVTLGWRWRPLDSVGVYVPGGLATYPSSVIMNAVPAKVAGVEGIDMVSPTPGGKVNPLLLLAAKLSGVKRIYRIGGAQAIAALAFGTETVAPVDKIVGPGNAYVNAAKRCIFGRVGIDMVAGPSEVVVIADQYNSPAWVAADLIAQCEHDETARAVLITDHRGFGLRVLAQVHDQLESLPRSDIARASWNQFGAVITTRDLDEAVELANCLAPEHLQLCVEDPESLLGDVRHAGAVFLGAWAPEAIGDYVAGPSHVLPTSGAARYASGLSVQDFVKRMSVTKLSREAFAEVGPHAETLARSEGLDGHGDSIRFRLRALK